MLSLETESMISDVITLIYMMRGRAMIFRATAL